MRDSTHLSQRAAQQAAEWAAAEGWNPGLDDVDRFLAVDPDAFLATEVDDQVAGTVSCAFYGDAYAFIGFYIVRADLRGRGTGGVRAAAGEDTPVVLDVPHANPAAVEIAAASLDGPVFETARMYRNGRPPEDTARVFGVTTFELG
jgi:acetyltransferase (GNAT) family protein